MANPKHLKILKQGVEVWNGWRENNPDKYTLDLTDVDLRGVRSHFRDGSGMGWIDEGYPDHSLVGAKLQGADFRHVWLVAANFHGAKLQGADFRNASLLGANLGYADLTRADLEGVSLQGANLTGTALTGARLVNATLYNTSFIGAQLDGVDFGQAQFSKTVFADTNLAQARNLDSCLHRGPSQIDHRTLAKSGNLPLEFLRGVGLPDTLIDYLPSLLGEPLQFYSCFISYSSKDQEFAERLHADLQNKGVRCWFAPEDLRIGARTRPAIDEAIRIRDKLLLILSKRSIESNWVEKEVETAFEEESRRKETVLFPIRLDNTVMETDEAWAADIRTRNIGDFRHWKDHDAYQKVFERLIRDLKQEADTSKKGKAASK